MTICKLNLRRGLTFLMFVASFATANSAFAYLSMTSVESICANAGNELLSSQTSCDSCHAGGPPSLSGPGADALRSNQNVIDFFCPPPVPPEPTCTDMDGDGFAFEGGACGDVDCNDTDPSINPGAEESCSDGVDNNCNGMTDAADPAAVNCPLPCTDMDGDGFSIEGGVCGDVDCNDADSSINPGAEESCSDGVDNNCNGMTDADDATAVSCPVACTDMDGDGFSIEGGVCGDMDCNDTDPSINPGAVESCSDGIDNNCDMMVDTADNASCPVVEPPVVVDPMQELRDQIMALQSQLTQCQSTQTGGYDDETDDDDHDEEEDGGNGHAYGKSKKNQ